MNKFTPVFAASLLAFGLAACDSGGSDTDNIDYNEYVQGADGKADSLFPAAPVCEFADFKDLEDSSRLDPLVDRSRTYNEKSRLRVTQARQIYLANVQLGFMDHGDDFNMVWDNTDDDEFLIHRIEIDDERYDWLQFWAGDTEIGVIYRYGTLDIVAEIGDGDFKTCESDTRQASANLDATAWVQTAAEYQANSKMTYRVATMMLDQAIEDTSWTATVDQGPNFENKPPAIILDLDETVIDNSPFQARLIADQVGYHSSRWNSWVNEANCSAVPGAVEFLRAADAKGVEIFYVSNRSSSLEEATRRNLEKLDLPINDSIDTVLLKNEEDGWGSDKTPRRERVAETHRIIMLFGDNLGDFVGGAKTGVEERNALEAANDENWGVKWFMLPNPMYGYWEGALYDHEFGVGEELKVLLKTENLNTKR